MRVGRRGLLERLTGMWRRARPRWEASPAGQLWRRAREIDLPTLTLALGAQQILCTGPLLIAASAVSRRVSGRGLIGVLINVLGLYGRSARDVVTLFAVSRTASTAALVTGLVIAAVFGTGVAATQQRGYEIIWEQPRAGMRSIFRQWLWVLGLLVFLVALVQAARLGRVIGGRGAVGVVTGGFGQFIAALLFMWWSQHLLLGGRLRWRRLLPGALCVAVGMTVLVVGSALVLADQITSTEDVYGPLGATFVLSAWLILLSGVIFGGALLGAFLADHRRASAARDRDRNVTRPFEAIGTAVVTGETFGDDTTRIGAPSPMTGIAAES